MMRRKEDSRHKRAIKFSFLATPAPETFDKTRDASRAAAGRLAFRFVCQGWEADLVEGQIEKERFARHWCHARGQFDDVRCGCRQRRILDEFIQTLN